MQQDYAESLLRSGIIEAKAGARSTAQRYLERALYASDNNKHETMAEAWFWMAEITDDPAGKRKALENALAHDPGHMRARRALAILDGKIRPDEIINPDALPPVAGGTVNADAARFMCPKCGGRMSFAPDGQSLVCDYCTRRETLAAGLAEAVEEDFLAAMSTLRGHGRPLAQKIFHCGGCGAEFMLPATLISTTCLYCGSPHVVHLEATRDLVAPEAVLPHAFGQRHAVDCLDRWIEANKAGPRSRWAAPRGFYLPIWTFDLAGDIQYTAEILPRGDSYGKEISSPVQVNDRFPIYVNDLPVPATRKLAKSLARLLPGFDLRALKAYDPGYLADWPAEVYDVPVGDASLDARSQAYHRLKPEMASALNDIHILSSSSAGMRVESFKLALIPVWMTRAADHGEDDLLLINGQSGAIGGREQEKRGLWEWLADVWEG